MTTLYQQVSNQILARIQSGEFSVGDRLPPEEAFSGQLGVSRSTLRLALTELERIGVLDRRRRTGTRVVNTEIRPQVSMIATSIQDLLTITLSSELKIIKTRTLTCEDSPKLESLASVSRRWMEICGVRYLDGQSAPFSINRVYLPARFSGIEPLLRPTETSIFSLIEDNYDVAVSRVSQLARAIACSSEEAELLGMQEGAPLLEIDLHLYLQEGDLMEISTEIFDPNRFQLRCEARME